MWESGYARLCKKKGRALCYTAGLLWALAKDKEYSMDSHDEEADPTSLPSRLTIQTFLPAVATLGSSSNKLTSTKPTTSCSLPFLSFDSSFLQSHQVWGLRESKNWMLLPFTPLCIHLYTQQLMDICVLLPSGSEWHNHKMISRIRSCYEIEAWNNP